MRIRQYEDDLVPICERCWIDENSLWEPESVDSAGNIITRLISVTVPIRLVPGTVNDCYICDKLTVVGIYVSENELYLEEARKEDARSREEDTEDREQE